MDSSALSFVAVKTTRLFAPATAVDPGRMAAFRFGLFVHSDILCRGLYGQGLPRFIKTSAAVGSMSLVWLLDTRSISIDLLKEMKMK